MYIDTETMLFFFLQEEDEKEQLSQAQEVGEDDTADHTEAGEDSFLGFSIEEVPKPQYDKVKGRSSYRAGSSCLID